jgi:hypothetical protein
MDPVGPRTPQETPAACWLGEHAGTLFAAIRYVIADSLCAYDVGLELAARVGLHWDTFDSGRHVTRLAWALGLAGELIAEAAVRGAVPTGDRRRNAHPEVVTLSDADLHSLSESARSPLPLDETARDVLATLERTAPSPRALSTLRASGLVNRAPGDVRREV